MSLQGTPISPKLTIIWFSVKSRTFEGGGLTSLQRCCQQILPVCIYVCACEHIYIYIYIYMYVCVRACLYMCVCVSLCMCVCVYVCMFIYVCMCIFVCVCVCVSLCVYRLASQYLLLTVAVGTFFSLKLVQLCSDVWSCQPFVTQAGDFNEIVLSSYCCFWPTKPTFGVVLFYFLMYHEILGLFYFFS